MKFFFFLILKIFTKQNKISVTQPKGILSKACSRVAKMTQEVGTAHLAIQIQNKVGENIKNKNRINNNK